MTTRLCVTCIFKSGSLCTKQWKYEPSIDPVNGRKRNGEHYMCATQRAFESNSCGAAGKWWTPTQAAKELIASDKPYKPNIFVRLVHRLLNLF